MTKAEMREVSQETLNIYSGILFHNQEFAQGKPEQIRYELGCPEYETLKSQYDLEKIAGKGGDFSRAKRLMHYLAPRLTHCSWYDNHVPCNALDLLEYSLNNPEQGINCRNKSKILQECCMALGIYARRVWIMPFSPYDFDNHVVTEIYDRGMKKWIMLDTTTDGYFVDEEKTPLSLLEMRRNFAQARFLTFVQSTGSLRELERQQRKHMDINSYICKNLFYFAVENVSTFGEGEKKLFFVPAGYSIRDNNIANVHYRIQNLPAEYADMKPNLHDQLQQLQEMEEPSKTHFSILEQAPV